MAKLLKKQLRIKRIKQIKLKIKCIHWKKQKQFYNEDSTNLI